MTQEAEKRADWRPLRGDGTDPVPPHGTRYEAKLRNGVIWTDLSITKFCLKFGRNLFRHEVGALDPVAIRIVEMPHD